MMNLSNKHILVTGGAGFIGSRMVSKLVEKNCKIRVIDDLSKGEASNLEPIIDKIKFIQGDLLKPEVANKVLKDIDVCFHFAAKIGGIGYFHKYPATSIRDNSIMNLNLWDAAKETKLKMVCISSSMVFERTSTFPTPEIAVEASPPPLTGYGFSKLMSEYIARTYYEEFNVPFLIIRPFNTFGPGENPGDYVGYAHVIPDIVKKILSGQYPIEILGDGSQTRAYTYVDDVVDGIIFAAEHAENDDFNVASGVETSVLELTELIWSIIGKKEPLKIKYLPSFKFDVKRRIPDISKIKKLGWEPKISLEQGLKTTIEWLRKRM